MSLKGWEVLSCQKCDGQDFIPVYRMQYQNGLGTSTRPEGYYCLGCKEKVDQAKMIAASKRREAEAKIKELDNEIKSL
jgi:hypothetical protein